MWEGGDSMLTAQTKGGEISNMTEGKVTMDSRNGKD